MYKISEWEIFHGMVSKCVNAAATIMPICGPFFHSCAVSVISNLPNEVCLEHFAMTKANIGGYVQLCSRFSAQIIEIPSSVFSPLHICYRHSTIRLQSHLFMFPNCAWHTQLYQFSHIGGEHFLSCSHLCPELLREHTHRARVKGGREWLKYMQINRWLAHVHSHPV